MFRSCTASLSSKSLARSTTSHVRLLAWRTRHFTADAPSESTTDPKPVLDEAKEPANTESKPDSELVSKLKTKEAEVVDLTASAFSCNGSSAIFLTFL